MAGTGLVVFAACLMAFAAVKTIKAFSGQTTIMIYMDYIRYMQRQRVWFFLAVVV